MGRRFDPRDHYFRRARSEGFRARSAFKLQELARKHRLFRRGAAVLDLGAAPGGFLQVIAEAVGPDGLALGVDLQEIRPFKELQVKLLKADAFEEGLLEQLRELHDAPFDVVVSDMAPSTTGSASADVARSHDLVERAAGVAAKVLRPGGTFVAKAFMGAGFEELVASLKPRFRQVRIDRPKATRARSRECFLVCTGLAG